MSQGAALAFLITGAGTSFGAVARGLNHRSLAGYRFGGGNLMDKVCDTWVYLQSPAGSALILAKGSLT